MPGRQERFCSAKGGDVTKVVAAAIVAPAGGTVASAQEFGWISEQIAEPTDLRRAREQELEEGQSERGRTGSRASDGGSGGVQEGNRRHETGRGCSSGRERSLPTTPPKNRTCEFPRVRLEPLAKAHVVLGK